MSGAWAERASVNITANSCHAQQFPPLLEARDANNGNILQDNFYIFSTVLRVTLHFSRLTF